MSRPSFHFATDHPLDMLDKAIGVVTFLQDLAPSLHSDNRDVHITDNGAHGLTLILIALEGTIEAASEKVKENSVARRAEMV